MQIERWMEMERQKENIDANTDIILSHNSGFFFLHKDSMILNNSKTFNLEL